MHHVNFFCSLVTEDCNIFHSQSTVKTPVSYTHLQLDKEIKDISGQSQILNQVMRKGYMDSALFMESSSKLGWQLTECRRKKTLLTRKLRRTKEIVRTEQLIQLIAEQDGLMEEFDEQLFKMTAEKIVVSKEHDITFCLYLSLIHI